MWETNFTDLSYPYFSKEALKTLDSLPLLQIQQGKVTISYTKTTAKFARTFTLIKEENVKTQNILSYRQKCINAIEKICNSVIQIKGTVPQKLRIFFKAFLQQQFKNSE